MIELINVKKAYVTKTGVRVDALKGINLKFPDSGMVFILGKSGSGKSTLLNLMGGLDSFDSGEMIVKGKPTKSFTQSNLDSYRNTSIGFVFQDYNILDEFTVGANIALAMELQGLKATSEKILNILDEVDLTGYGKRKPNELSGGQLQRVAIARALVKNPEIIMADEPTGALDSNTGLQVFDTLKKLSKNKLVIIVSHDREYAELYGDRVIELADGLLISDLEKVSGTPQTMSEGVTIIDESFIKIKKGYELDENEIKMLVSYLLNSKSDTYISNDEYVNSKFKRIAYINDDLTRDTFKPTDEEKIVKSDSEKDLTLVKSRLPQKVAFKIAFNSLGYKKFRLAITIIMTLISLTLFCLSDSLASFNPAKSLRQSMHDEKADYISIMKSYTQITDEGIFGESEQKNYYQRPMYKRDITELSNLTNKNFMPVWDFTNISTSFYYQNLNAVFDYQNQYYLYRTNLAGGMEITSTQLRELGFAIQGRLPEDENEIAITQYAFSHYREFGYNYDDDEGNSIKIDPSGMNETLFLTKSPKIRITLTNENNTQEVKLLTITGIIDTNIPEGLDENSYDLLVNMFLTGNKTQSIITNGYHAVTYFAPNTIEEMLKYTNTTTPAIGFYSYYDDVHNYYGREYGFNIKGVIETGNYIAFDGNHNRELKNNEVVISTTCLKDAFYGDDELLEKIANGDLDVKFEFIENIDIKIVGYYNASSTNPGGWISSHEIMAGPNIKEMVNGEQPKILYAISKLSESEIDKFVDLHLDENNSFRIQSYIVTAITMFSSIAGILSKILMWVGLVLIFMGSLVLMNFIASSIGNKRKEIGILRAIGSRGRDVFNIFFTESLIIATFNFIIAMVVSSAIAIYFNNYMRSVGGMVITLLSIGIRQFAVLLGVSVLAAFIGSFLPIINVARKKPIDAIRKR
ncbi:MAG: ATP-binding cassette domain-containing protein [Christensenellaceae bacterium]|jgi:ABC-type lipoprotein export system ATPase subunit/ABC-type antimicrobial peptide transport system permease subunit|nr:ATP-binding cassette domain-containing protein [Christensenellaceae bacterium]